MLSARQVAQVPCFLKLPVSQSRRDAYRRSSALAWLHLWDQPPGEEAGTYCEASAPREIQEPLLCSKAPPRPFPWHGQNQDLMRDRCKHPATPEPPSGPPCVSPSSVVEKQLLMNVPHAESPLLCSDRALPPRPSFPSCLAL